MNAREALDRWGTESVSARVLEARWAEEEAIGWVEVGSSAVALGSPLCAPERRDESRVRFAVIHDAVFFGRELAEGEAVPERAYVVGEQPWWDAATWPATVAGSRTIRSQVRRAANKGVRILALDHDQLSPGTTARHAVDALVAEWLRVRHMAPMAFAAAVEPFAHADLRRYFLAVQHERLVGLLVATTIPARKAWVLDHIVRTRSSPNGTAEALIDGAIRDVGSRGAREVTMGLSPLAGRVPRPLALVRHYTRGLYDFAGLYEFKAKLLPTRWERVVVEHPDRTALAGTLLALRAFAGDHVVSFALRSLLRLPPPALRLMALAVVPWIALLLRLRPLLPYPTWLPVWLVFDACFAIGLLLLARRLARRHTRRRLHVALIVAASIDACASLAQHLAWNLPRHDGPIEWTVASASWLVPAAVAALLASGLRHREDERFEHPTLE